MLIDFPLEQCFRESILLLRFYAGYILTKEISKHYQQETNMPTVVHESM
jgi:hypothetical protein